ncbi:unnamed protein product [Peronospora belbahrii]|uniref:FYVE-type domain-containing protein n=1 Tax=Peronospora belbahrii TaxID=622444 RepID=A0AAU9KSI8_9STRA|nr:unnamed protein product [Peronospora belbahrii]
MAAYTPEIAQLPPSSAAVAGSSSIASMVVVGHLDGNLNDVMYGLMATDTAELKLRLQYMVDPEVLDTSMMSCIEKPSAAKPFHFVGKQWVRRGETSRVNSNSRRPRDFVLLVASGVMRHKISGQTEAQEIGYYLCHSMEMQECELSYEPARGWLSTCSLFTPTNGSSAQTDVFSRGYVNFKGKMQDYQAEAMMSSLMLAGVAEAASCGRSKKLSWMLMNVKGAAEEFRRRQPEAKSASNCCGICDRKFGVLHSVASCTLCQVIICSRCRVSRDLCFLNRQDVVLRTTYNKSVGESRHQGSRQVECRTVLLCKNCKMNASHMDASVMARQEAKDRYGFHETARTDLIDDSRISHSCSQSGSEVSYQGEGTAEISLWTPVTDTTKLQGCNDTTLLNEPRDDMNDVVKTKVVRVDNGHANWSDSAVNTTLDSSFASTLPSPRDRDSSQEEYSMEVSFTCPYEPRLQYSTHETSTSAGQYQADLMRRMQELQKSAESVYQFTSRMSANTHYRHDNVVSLNSKVYISELD